MLKTSLALGFMNMIHGGYHQTKIFLPHFKSDTCFVFLRKHLPDATGINGCNSRL